jgi:hypothetical protein
MLIYFDIMASYELAVLDQMFYAEKPSPYIVNSYVGIILLSLKFQSFNCAMKGFRFNLGF